LWKETTEHRSKGKVDPVRAMNSMNKSVNEPVISVIFNFSSEWREWSDLPSSYLKPEDKAPATH
jgi:hypothetical protein